MEKLERQIIKVLQQFPEKSARWIQIRNALLTKDANADEKNAFNVKLTRALNKLENAGYIKKVTFAHKLTIYSLTSKQLEDGPDVYPLLYGAFDPTGPMPSYEKFKKKVLEVIKHVSTCENLEFHFEYQRFKEEWKKMG